MKVLVLFERSGSFRDALSAAGHTAISCDLQESTTPGPHLTMDYKLALKFEWDTIIAFLPCTYTSKAAMHLAYLNPVRLKGFEWTIEAFHLISSHSAPIKVIENPPGYISTNVQRPSLIIQPSIFGDPFRKQFTLWTTGVPPLMLSAASPERRSEMIKGNGQMSSQQRQNVRSSWVYYPLMIDAMVSQWFPKKYNHFTPHNS